MVRLLVTGGAGFIGARCAALALESGHRITILDDLSTGLRSRLDALEAAGAVDGGAPDRQLQLR